MPCLKNALGTRNISGVYLIQIKEMVKQQQQQEVEKAIIGYSQYQLRTQFSSLAVTEEKWFRMT